MKSPLKRPLVIVLASSFVFFACRKTDHVPTGSSTSGSSEISSPVTLDLLPAQNQAEADRRLFLPVMQVGAIKLSSRKLIFDSGSEGFVFSATSLFPASLICDTGMIIHSKDSAVINGITITDTKVSASYGDPPATRTFYGNISYASIVIGDNAGSITTLRMPFMLVYKGVNNQTNQAIAVDSSSDGIAGVSSSGFNTIVDNGLVSSFSELKSPFNYLTYTNGVDAGFMLDPLNSIQGWTTTPSNTGSPATPLLTVGLTNASEAGFALQLQRLSGIGVFDPNLLGTIRFQNTTVDNTDILFDTGTPVGDIIYTNSVARATTLSSGVNVQLSTSEGFAYNYTTDGGFFQTTVSPTGQTRSIFGIDFFLNNYFLLDYTQHLIGLKKQ